MHETSQTILIVAHAWNDDLTGGSFKVATDFARFLVTQGHTVHYLCGSTTATNNPEIVDGVHVWRYPYPTCSGPRSMFSHIKRCGQLFKRISQLHAIDVVNGHSPLQYYAVARHGRKKLRPRRVFTVHSPFMDELHSAGRKSRWTKLASRWIDGRCVRHSHTTTTASNYTLHRMKEIYGSKTLHQGVVKSFWVDTNRFQPTKDKTSLRQQLGEPWDADIPCFFTVRRLERRMGLEQLIEAAKQLASEGEVFRVLIGGSGSLAPKLRSQITESNLEKYVSLLGRISEEDLAPSYAAADSFILPTLALECFGLIILEAYSSGVPVIATPVAAIPEIVCQHSHEWLSDNTSANSLAIKMRKFLKGELAFNSGNLRKIAEKYNFHGRASELADCVLGTRETSMQEG